MPRLILPWFGYGLALSTSRVSLTLRCAVLGSADGRATDGLPVHRLQGLDV